MAGCVRLRLQWRAASPSGPGQHLIVPYPCLISISSCIQMQTFTMDNPLILLLSCIICQILGYQMNITSPCGLHLSDNVFIQIDAHILIDAHPLSSSSFWHAKMGVIDDLFLHQKCVDPWWAAIITARHIWLLHQSANQSISQSINQSVNQMQLLSIACCVLNGSCGGCRNFISLVTFCLGLEGEELQTA